LWYAVKECGADEFHECKVEHISEYQWANVEKCAQDFHWDHAGWECSWPLTFILKLEEDGPVVGVFEVEREYSPSFSATELHDGISG
jgi:hypothetical protein